MILNLFSQLSDKKATFVFLTELCKMESMSMSRWSKYKNVLFSSEVSGSGKNQ